MPATATHRTRRTRGCFVRPQVKDGTFTRVYLEKAGTMDCSKSNIVKMTYDNK